MQPIVAVIAPGMMGSAVAKRLTASAREGHRHDGRVRSTDR